MRLAHNLLLESYVSRLATIEKMHPGCHALLLDHLFMYKTRQAEARLARLQATMRSTTGGGLTLKAKSRADLGRPLRTANGSKIQLGALCAQVELQAALYSVKELRKRKTDGLWQRLAKIRQDYDAVRTNLAACHVWHRRQTCYVTESGRKRKAPPTAIGCIGLIGEQPAPGSIVKKGRGNFYKNATQIKAGRAAMVAHFKELQVAAKRQEQKRPVHRTGKQERRSADAAAKRQQAHLSRAPAKRQKGQKGQKVAAREQVVADLEVEEEEAEAGGDGLMSEDEDGEEDEAGAAAAEITVLRDRAAKAEALVLAMQLQQQVLGEMKRMERIMNDLKAYQNAFKAEHKRAPLTDDNPTDIRALYAEYERLKAVAKQRPDE